MEYSSSSNSNTMIDTGRRILGETGNTKGPTPIPCIQRKLLPLDTYEIPPRIPTKLRTIHQQPIIRTYNQLFIPILSFLFILILAITNPVSAGGGNFLTRSNTPKFSSQGFKVLDDHVGLKDIDGFIAAYGDFNGDKSSDLFVLSSDQSTVNIFVWDHKSWKYTNLESAVIKINQPSQILNVVPGDYDRDGMMDVMVLVSIGSDSKKADMRIYFGNKNAFESNYTTINSSPISAEVHPFLLDFYGDMGTDMLGYLSKSTSQLTIWKHQMDTFIDKSRQHLGLDRTKLYNESSITITDSEKKNNMCDFYTGGHWNAFIDLNGDCLADMVVFCEKMNGIFTKTRYFQVWVNSKTGGEGDKGGFKFLFQGELPPDTQMVSFADMNGNGAIDLIAGTSDSIYILHNDRPSELAEDEDLCTARDFTFRSYTESFKAPLSSLIPTRSNPKFLLKDPLLRHHSLRIADYNHDGYPDMFVVVTSDSGISAHILESQACVLNSVLTGGNTNYNGKPDAAKKKELCDSTSVPGSGVHSYGERAYIEVNQKMDDFNNLITKELGAQDLKSVMGTWVDVDEDGTFDLLLNVAYEVGGGKWRRTSRFAFNYFFNDAFFMKTIMLNGVCPHNEFKPYGANYIGATFKYEVIDYRGTKRQAQVAQMPQTSFFALNTPYALFGLGRTNNYIDLLYVGANRRQGRHYATQAGVIPNSQLIIIPCQPNADSTSEDWTWELYMNPSDFVEYVFVALVVTLFVLLVLVAGLGWAERKEDEFEKRQLIHEINFDAL